MAAAMDRVLRLACSLGWPPALRRREEERRLRQQMEEEEEEERRRRQCHCNMFASAKRFLRALESLLLWENTCISASVVVAFNVLFWGFVVLDVRDLAVVGSTALVSAFLYGVVEALDDVEFSPRTSQTDEQIEKLIKNAKHYFETIMRWQQEQPKMFCTVLCSVTLSLWIIGRNFDSVFVTYVVCMGILTGPAVLLRSPSPNKYVPNKGWDSEVDEFLPAITEANLQVLKWAGETGRSATPPSPDMGVSQDQFEDDLVGLRMPSHEDGSTDGLDLSELELSTADSDLDAVRFKNAYFEGGSSSSDDVDLGIDASSKLNVDVDADDDDDDDDNGDDDDSSDSEFEMIDSRELENLKNV